MGAILVLPLVLALVALVVIALWLRRRADGHAEAVNEFDHIVDPRERELAMIRRQHEVADAGVDRSSGTDVAYPTDVVPGLTRSEHGGPGQSGARVPYAEGAGPDADPLV